MAQLQKPKKLGTPGGGGNVAQQYLSGQANVGTSAAGTDMQYAGFSGLFSPDAGTMATSWDLPPNAGALRLNTGNPQTSQVPAKQRTAISSGLEMLNLYDKMDSGEKLTPADLNAASKLGGDIERGAQLASSGKATKQSKAAVVKAQNEIAQRLVSTVGLKPEDLGKAGMNSKVPPSFASTMQNAGYAVTKNMTVKQALGSAQATELGGGAPTTMQSNMTVSQYIQSMARMSKGQITQLQQQLFNNGFYDSSYYGGNDTTKGAEQKEYTQGVLDNGTMLAFRKAVLQTLADQKKGKNVTLDGVITGGASTNPALGNTPVTSGTSDTGAPAAFTVPMATTAQTQQPLINAFVAALGRNPSQSELAAFTKTYQGDLEAGNTNLAKSGLSPGGVVDYSTGIPFVQGVPTVSAAATNFAEDQDSTEYQAHNVANAFGMLMNLVDRAGTSSLDTPGTRPTTTT